MANDFFAEEEDPGFLPIEDLDQFKADGEAAPDPWASYMDGNVYVAIQYVHFSGSMQGFKMQLTRRAQEADMKVKYENIGRKIAFQFKPLAPMIFERPALNGNDGHTSVIAGEIE